MAFNYEADPQRIEQESFRLIRDLVAIENFDPVQQQVLLRMVHSLGTPEIVGQARFSNNACEQGLKAITQASPLLCDVEMVKHGITKRLISREPLCYVNHEQVAPRAKENGETRAMAAVELWAPQLEDSIVIIGNAPTALFRLLEMLQSGAPKPALIIGMPVGFVGAAEAKQTLWDHHELLGVECITLLGRQGGSAVACAVCNALLRCHHGDTH